MAGVTRVREESPGWAIPTREAKMNALDAFDAEGSEAAGSPSVVIPSPERPPVSLAPLKVETEDPEADRAPSANIASPERPPVSLAALKVAGIQCNGDEAVAIGQALCRALKTAQLLRRINPDADSASVSSPTVETVLIDVTSRVGVTVEDPGDTSAAIQSVGRILVDILPTDLRPLLETKIISKAVASPPQFGTLDELLEALDGYRQPDGRKLIQAVYERWEQRVMPTTALATIAADRTPTLSTPDSEPAAAFRSRTPVAVVGAASIAAVAIIAISGWFLMNPSRAASTVAVEIVPLPGKPITPATGANFPGLMPALVDGKHDLVHGKDLAGSQKPAVPDRRVARAEPPASFAPIRSVARTEPPSVSGLPIPRLAGRPLSAFTPQLTGRAVADAPSVRRTTDEAIRSNGGVASALNSAAPETGRNTPARSNSISRPWPAPTATSPTYSADDRDVTPPIPVAPRLLAGLEPSSPGVRLDALTIAVLVNGDGTAYSVRALNRPQNMGEYVLLTAALSVVKGWQFSPAMRDGVPVMYRLVVPLRAVTAVTP